MHPELDNPAWRAMTGAQQHASVGSATARRFRDGYSPMMAFADLADPDFDALQPHCAPGERLYCGAVTGAIPPAWHVHASGAMCRMVWAGGVPTDDASDVLDAFSVKPLDTHHAEQALALAQRTHPGPFGPRTIELGAYLGAFDGDRLIAMAGERFFTGHCREISGVATDPAYQGRGLARRLMLRLIRAQHRRGETTFLHVRSDNTTARGLYQRMGFQVLCEVPLRVVSLDPEHAA